MLCWDRMGEFVSVPRFLVYRKPKKDNFIHFLSCHDMRMLSGVVIGFYSQVFMIFSDEFPYDECRVYICNKSV